MTYLDCLKLLLSTDRHGGLLTFSKRYDDGALGLPGNHRLLYNASCNS